MLLPLTTNPSLFPNSSYFLLCIWQWLYGMLAIIWSLQFTNDFGNLVVVTIPWYEGSMRTDSWAIVTAMVVWPGIIYIIYKYNLVLQCVNGTVWRPKTNDDHPPTIDQALFLLQPCHTESPKIVPIWILTTVSDNNPQIPNPNTKSSYPSQPTISLVPWKSMMLIFPLCGGWPKPRRGEAATGPIVAKRSLLSLQSWVKVKVNGKSCKTVAPEETGAFVFFKSPMQPREWPGCQEVGEHPPVGHPALVDAP